MSKLKEFYVMAKDWEDAEEIGYMEEQDWEFSYDEAEIYSEEIDNVVNLNLERNRRIENGKA